MPCANAGGRPGFVRERPTGSPSGQLTGTWLGLADRVAVGLLSSAIGVVPLTLTPRDLTIAQALREGPMRKMLRLAAITSLALATPTLGEGTAGAAQGDHHQPNTCTGTFKAPGVLAGKYKGDVVVTGVCVVNGGAAVVKGDLILAPGLVLERDVRAQLRGRDRYVQPDCEG